MFMLLKIKSNNSISQRKIKNVNKKIPNGIYNKINENRKVNSYIKFKSSVK